VSGLPVQSYISSWQMAEAPGFLQLMTRLVAHYMTASSWSTRGSGGVPEVGPPPGHQHSPCSDDHKKNDSIVKPHMHHPAPRDPHRCNDVALPLWTGPAPFPNVVCSRGTAATADTTNVRNGSWRRRHSYNAAMRSTAGTATVGRHSTRRESRVNSAPTQRIVI